MKPCWDVELHHTLINRAWLDNRFRRGKTGDYVAHEPIWGLGRGKTEGGHLRRALRLHDVVSLLVAAGIGGSDSVLDIGAAEGYLSYLIGLRTSAASMTVDLSTEACRRATEFFGLRAIGANASLLPFPDQSVDVVVMTEVIEHLLDPITAILEAQRVARRLCVISTEEWASSPAERVDALGRREYEGHMERNIFCDADVKFLFGERRTVRFDQRFVDMSKECQSAGNLTAQLRDMATRSVDVVPGGGIVICNIDGTLDPATLRPAPADERILEVLSEGAVELDASGSGALRYGPARTVDVPIACPMCHKQIDSALRCKECSWSGVTEGGVISTFAYRPSAENVRLACLRSGIPIGRTEKLLRLDDQFKLASASTLEWRELLREENSGWSSNGILRMPDGWLVASTSDPQLISPFIGAPMDLVRSVELELEYGALNGEHVEVYFLTDQQFAFEHEMRADLSVHATRPQVIEVDIPAAVRARGQHVVRIRIDPSIREGSRFRVRRCTLASSAKL